MGFIFLLLVVTVSLKSALTLWQQRSVLSEFGASRSLAIAVLLYPIGMAALILLPERAGLLGAAGISLAAFAPAIALSKSAQKKLQRAGTDRAQPAEEIAANVFMTGIGCILYFLVGTAISIGSQYSSNPY
ncbi:hypothetical protein GTZ97_03790 [Aquabacterium fontiphilum]|uniref:hypothetical protein n=1 Tax=Aquabacterium fontiphilum TaxID=450365 RepID=UPI001378197E|nr:hypothetical protein [Aquabacterium fontiphilum]NBD19793.1 hypothetical protein [Aquabacterium fontiphilum]